MIQPPHEVFEPNAHRGTDRPQLKDVESPLARLVLADEGLWPPQTLRQLGLREPGLQSNLS